MAYCDNCGHPHPVKATFCGRCGTLLTTAVSGAAHPVGIRVPADPEAAVGSDSSAGGSGGYCGSCGSHAHDGAPCPVSRVTTAQGSHPEPFRAGLGTQYGLRNLRRGVGLLVIGSIFALVATFVSLVAWSKWYLPQRAPTAHSTQQSILNGLGSGSSLGSLAGPVSQAHGFDTVQGRLGLLVAIALLAGIALLLARRTRAPGAGVLLIAGLGMLALSVEALRSSIEAAFSWSSYTNNIANIYAKNLGNLQDHGGLFGLAGTGLVNSYGLLLSQWENGIAQVVARMWIEPAAVVTGAGILALTGALMTIGGTVRSRRVGLMAPMMPEASVHAWSQGGCQPAGSVGSMGEQ